MQRLIVLDFDGTLTDAAAEAEAFLPPYRSDLAVLMGCPSIEGWWNDAVAAVNAAPDHHGWRYNGRIVAPAHTDPYVLTACVAHLLLDRAGLFPEPKERRKHLQALFYGHYRRIEPVFKPRAASLLETLLGGDVPVFIVTNSHTDAVQHRLDALDAGLRQRIAVRGNARKFMLGEPAVPCPRFAAVPEQTCVDGLDRPIFLRRGHYYDALRSVWQQTGTEPEGTVVCGDLYELDLALPATLGTWTHLVTRPTTAPYERVAVTRNARGSASDDLMDIPQLVA